MRITELFTAQSIALDEAQQDRSQIIDRLVELQATHGNIRDKEAYKKGLYEREDEGSTYVDNGITVPHAKCDCVTRPSLAALRLKTPVQYNAEDDGVCGILALAGLMGERSAFLTTSSADEYDVPGMPDDPQSEYRYVSEGSALPMVWTCDGEGYPVRADATYELRVYKEHKVTGERTLVRTTSYRSRYEVLYAE